jgi:hypothetical protein
MNSYVIPSERERERNTEECYIAVPTELPDDKLHGESHNDDSKLEVKVTFVPVLQLSTVKAYWGSGGMCNSAHRKTCLST